MKFKHAVLYCGKFFESVYADDEKTSKQPNPSSELSKQYHSNMMSNAELGELTGTYQNLVLCIGVGIKRDGNNGCLVRKGGGTFVWTNCTLTKLGGSSQEDTAGK